MKNPLISFARAFYSNGIASPPHTPTRGSRNSISSAPVNPSHSPDSLIHNTHQYDPMDIVCICTNSLDSVHHHNNHNHKWTKHQSSCPHANQPNFNTTTFTTDTDFLPTKSKAKRLSFTKKSKSKHRKLNFAFILPTEICLHIFSYLTPSAVIKVSCCSQALYALSNDVGVWRAMYRSNPHWWKSKLSKLGPLSRSSMNLVAYRNQLPSPPVSPTKQGVVNEDVNGDIIMHDVIPRFVDWKNLYKNRTLLDHNWANNQPKCTILRGHLDSVYCIQFDANKIVSGSRDQTVKIWSLATGETLRTLSGHTGSVLCLQYTDLILVTGSSDTTVMVWDMQLGTCLCTLTGHSAGVLDVACDNEWIVSCSKDASIKVWICKAYGQYTLRHTLQGHRAAVNAIQLNGDILVSASGDYLLKVWNVRTGTLLRTLEGHTRGIACVAFDGHLIISGSNDQTIRVWDVHSGHCVHEFVGHKDLVRTLALDSCRGLVCSGSYDQSVKLWQLPARVMRIVHQSQLTKRLLTIRANGSAAGAGGHLVRKDAATTLLDMKQATVASGGEQPSVMTQTGPTCSFESTHSSWVFNVACSPTHLVSASQDQTIVVYDYTEGVDTTVVI